MTMLPAPTAVEEVEGASRDLDRPLLLLRLPLLLLLSAAHAKPLSCRPPVRVCRCCPRPPPSRRRAGTCWRGLLLLLLLPSPDATLLLLFAGERGLN